MKAQEGQHSVRAWSREGLLLESYRYAPGPASALPKHTHEEYQIGLSLDFPGEYRYRGTSHGVPVGSLSVIHPGEMHSARDPKDRQTPATYRMLYADPDLLGRVATGVAGRETGLPFFANPIILDKNLARRFLGLHKALEGQTTRLEKESRLLSLLEQFVARHADIPSSTGPVGKEHRAVKLVRGYLEDNYAEDVSLGELASLANLSPFHLARVFKQEVGLPPHAYQVEVRLRRARDLLLRGWPVVQVAQRTGFADQSHLTRHFKRLVGVPPGQYVRGPAKNSKNVQ